MHLLNAGLHQFILAINYDCISFSEFLICLETGSIKKYSLRY